MQRFTEKRTSFKILRDKVFNIAKNTKYGGQQRIIASSDYKCFDKKSTSVGAIRVKLSQTN